MRILLVLIAAVCAPAVLAQEYSPSWTGSYIGLQVGNGLGIGELTSPNSGVYNDLKLRGSLGGAYAGFNYQFENGVVLGGELDVTAHSAFHRNDRQEHGTPLWVATGYDDSQSIKWSAAFRVRLGYTVNQWLPYVSIGREVAVVEQTNRNDYIVINRDTYTFSGWAIGVGVEYAVSEALTLRTDYRFSNYDSRTDLISKTIPIQSKLENHQLRFGIAYRF